MLQSAPIKTAVARSGWLLVCSLAWAIGLYLAVLLAVTVVGLISLLTGWYTFAIESGPAAFLLGYTMHIDNRTNFEVLVEPGLLGFFLLVVAVGLLNRVPAVMRAVRTSLRSWADL